MSSRPLIALLTLAAPAAHAVELAVQVHTPDVRPLAQVVVMVDPLPAPDTAPPAPADAVIDQVNRSFDPFVSVVRTGTEVAFPNRDDIRHHVYSFSEAKTFELPLYKGTPAEPVVFDRAGIVTLACNIHDWMLAYLYVTDARWFDVTGNDGTVTLDLPDHDAYRVTIWHPSLGPDGPGRTVELVRDGPRLEYRLQLEHVEPPGPRRLRRGSGRYR